MTPLLTAAGVADLLNVPKSWVYAEARAGRIPHITVGRYRRFSPESIEEWAKKRERGPRSMSSMCSWCPTRRFGAALQEFRGRSTNRSTEHNDDRSWYSRAHARKDLK